MGKCECWLFLEIKVIKDWNIRKDIVSLFIYIKIVVILLCMFIWKMVDFLDCIWNKKYIGLIKCISFLKLKSVYVINLILKFDVLGFILVWFMCGL